MFLHREVVRAGDYAFNRTTARHANPLIRWVAAFDTWYKRRLDGRLAALQANGKNARKASRPSLPAPGYAGRYADAWYGPIEIAERSGKLRIGFKQTPNMAGTLSHWQYDTFRTEWDDSSIEPAYVTFALDAEGKVAHITMKPVSPLADFSCDYQDLMFTPSTDGRVVAP